MHASNKLGPLSARRRADFEATPAVICAKTAEPIEMPFGMWARMRRKHKFSRIRQVWRQYAHTGYIGATWRIRLNRPSAAPMRSYVKLL